jgi:hypothetical protein
VEKLSLKQYVPLLAAKFRVKLFELCESSICHVWCFLISKEHGMKLTNQYANADINKASVIVIKLTDNLFDHGHSL